MVALELSSRDARVSTWAEQINNYGVVYFYYPLNSVEPRFLVQKERERFRYNISEAKLNLHSLEDNLEM